ncbi:hypothetical protein AOLI_G00198510 [Acnodon oligacanthus]
MPCLSSQHLAAISTSGVLFSRISGAEVKMRVRRGDNITLYCDCIIRQRSEIAWFRKCSDENHFLLVLTSSSSFKRHFPGFGFVRNSSSKSYDLLIENVTEKDLGLFYCARQEKKVTTDKNGLKRETTVYRYGGLTTQIILIDTTLPSADRPQTTPIPPASDCSICWKVLVSVCPVCVLLSSTCVYCICRCTTKVGKNSDISERETNENRKTRKTEAVGGDDVCYASLDLPSRGQKRLKKTRVECSEFSVYSEVKTDKL